MIAPLDAVLPLAALSDSRTLLEGGLILVLFDAFAAYDELAARLEQGATVTGAKAQASAHADLGEGAIPMFVLEAGAGLRILVAGDDPSLSPGDELIGLARPPADPMSGA